MNTCPITLTPSQSFCLVSSVQCSVHNTLNTKSYNPFRNAFTFTRSLAFKSKWPSNNSLTPLKIVIAVIDSSEIIQWIKVSQITNFLFQLFQTCSHVELLRYLCILVIIDKNYRQMIDILHSTACVIAMYKIIEAALVYCKGLYMISALKIYHQTQW